MDIGSYKWNDAMREAQNYSGGGFNDWRLPTRGELDLMYKNLKSANLGGFADSWYWSSSQAGIVAGVLNTNATRMNFRNGRQNNALKIKAYTVRAVRVF